MKAKIRGKVDGEPTCFSSFEWEGINIYFIRIKLQWTFSLIILSNICGLVHFYNGVGTIIVTGINGLILGFKY